MFVNNSWRALANDAAKGCIALLIVAQWRVLVFARCVTAAFPPQIIRQPGNGVRKGETTCDLVGNPLYFVLATSAAAIAAVNTTVALIATPNNYDSLTYHLPHIEQWIRQ